MNGHPVKRVLQLLGVAAVALLATSSNAGLISQSGPRYFSAAAESGEWADVYVATSGLGAQLATNGLVVGVDGSSINDFEPAITPSTGCSLTVESAGAYDGETAIKLVPPDNTSPGNTYCAIINGLNLTNGGSTDIAQINIRFVAVFGPRYIDLATDPKWLSFQVSTTPGGAVTNRAAIFERYEADPSMANGRIFAVTSDEKQSWHSPLISDCAYWDCGTPTQKGFIIRTTANHGGSPAVAGPNEPIYFEMELDVRQNRGNANGRNRLYVRTRDGLINRTIDIPLSWEETWSFTWDQIIAIEGLGWYWNNPGAAANVDTWIRFSHIALSVNRAVDDEIGPPPGFNTGFLLLLVVQLHWLRRLARVFVMKRVWSALLLFWSIASLAAPIIDASGSAGAGCSADATPSVAVTVSAGSDRYGIGYVYWEGAVTVSAAAFGAQTPTLHHTHSGANFLMYRLDDPSTGAQTFSVTISGAAGRCYIAWLTYQGASSLGTAVEDFVSGGATVDVNVSSAAGDLVIDGAEISGTAIIVGAGQTSRVEQDDLDSAGRSFGASDEPGAGTVTMSWGTGGAAEEGFIIAANLVAAGASSSGLLRRRRGN
jgi:hypothetical protein